MSAQTKARSTRRIGSPNVVDPVVHPELPVKADEIIYQGAGVCVDSSGRVVNASEATGLVTLGVYRNSEVGTVDATGDADGDEVINGIEMGTYEFFNAADADAITLADVRKTCYWVDNQTVSDVSTGRSAAGQIYDYNAVTNMVSVTIR